MFCCILQVPMAGVVRGVSPVAGICGYDIFFHCIVEVWPSLGVWCWPMLSRDILLRYSLWQTCPFPVLDPIVFQWSWSSDHFPILGYNCLQRMFRASGLTVLYTYCSPLNARIISCSHRCLTKGPRCHYMIPWHTRLLFCQPSGKWVLSAPDLSDFSILVYKLDIAFQWRLVRCPWALIIIIENKNWGIFWHLSTMIYK